MAISNQIQSVKRHLRPELQSEPVTQELLRLVSQAVYQSTKISTPARVQELILADVSASSAELGDSFGPPRNLNYADFVSFSKSLHHVLLLQSLQSPQVALADDPAAKLNTALVAYFSAYFKGNYIDRWGQKVASPTTLSDDR